MLFPSDVIVRIFILTGGLAIRYAAAAPTSSVTVSSEPTHTSTPLDPASNPNPNPYGVDPSSNNSSPMTTIIIVCVVGTLALLGAAWGAYSCVATRRKPPPVFTAPGGNIGEPTTMICIPGESYPTTAMPSLRYNSPHTQTHPDLEATEVGPGIIIPPPPSYDAATGGRLPECPVGARESCRPMRTTSESRWKDLLVSQGRD